MSSCCDTTDVKTDRSVLTVALAGNPNSGKTTLFNALTGLRQKVANYPGVTVEKKTGRCKLGGGRVANVIDLPGTYSLISRSPDEHVAMEVLRGLRADTPAPDVVIVVVDASNLQRNLYLVSQLVELGRPLVVALNMMDVAERRGLAVSPQRLSQRLGVPVAPMVGHKRKGVDELKAAISMAKVAPLPQWSLPDAMREELVIVGGGLAILDDGPAVPGLKPEGMFDAESRPQADLLESHGSKHARLDRFTAIAERLLIGDTASDLGEIARRQPVASLLTSAVSRLGALGIEPMQADIEAHYHWIDQIAAGSLVPACERIALPGKTLEYESHTDRTLSEKIDRILIHKVWGLLIFAVLMACLFVTIFWLAKPIMDALQGGITMMGNWTTHKLPEGPIKALLNDGVFAGVGAVVVFVPQIALLFMFLSIMEDSGYLARAAFLMDRLLSKVGLHGKSFIPLLSSFACAIPGIMAARTIENRKDRLATILVAPFMSCSARLPVYALLIGTLFAHYGAMVQGGIVLGCYLLGIVAAVGTAWVFKRSLLKGGGSAFILEMPTYKLPQWSQVLRQVWINSRAFLTKAGTVIFCFSVILWAMSYYPRLPGIDDGSLADKQLVNDLTKSDVDAAQWMDKFVQTHPEAASRENVLGVKRIGQTAATIQSDGSLSDKEKIEKLFALGTSNPQSEWAQRAVNEAAAAQSEYSIAGRIGHFIEPTIRPLGFDWKMGIGLVSAFAARETFVSAMGITYAVGQAEDGQTDSLSAAMQADRYASGPKAGQPVWTPLVAISLLVWFVLAMQCMSTIAIIRRETGGWGWPIFTLVYMNGLAYVVSLAVFQIGSMIWHA